MNAVTASVTQTKSGLGAAVFAAILGFAIVAVTGLAQAETLHAAAHDVRHATGFPCH